MLRAVLSCIPLLILFSSEALLAAGADPNYRRTYCEGKPDDRSALDLACSAGYRERNVVRLLCKAAVDVKPTPTMESGKKDGTSPLMRAVETENVDMVEALLF